MELPENVTVTLAVALPRGREFELREEAPASQLAGGDEVTALALIGRLARAGVVRYADTVQPVLDLFEQLKQAAAAAGFGPAGEVEPPLPFPTWCSACGHETHAGRRCNAGPDARTDPDRQFANSYNYGKCVCGVESPTVGPGSLTPREVQRVQRDRDALARMVGYARGALGEAGYEPDRPGDDHLAEAIRRIATDRLELTHEVEALRKHVETAEGDLARYRAELNAAGMPQSPGGVRKLAGQVATSAADNRGLRREHAAAWQAIVDAGGGRADLGDDAGMLGRAVREIVRDVAAARKWRNALLALDSSSTGLPYVVRSAAGGPLFTIGAADENGGVSVYIGGPDGDGIRIGGQHSRALFLAAVRSLIPPAVSE